MSRQRGVTGWKFRMLRRFWRLRLRSRVLFWFPWLYDRWDEAQCCGSTPALMWIPVGGAPPHQEPGYFRSGSRQNCQLFARHKGLCLSWMDAYGEETPDGTYFQPDPNYLCPRCIEEMPPDRTDFVCPECGWTFPIPPNWPRAGEST